MSIGSSLSPAPEVHSPGITGLGRLPTWPIKGMGHDHTRVNIPLEDIVASHGGEVLPAESPASRESSCPVIKQTGCPIYDGSADWT